MEHTLYFLHKLRFVAAGLFLIAGGILLMMLCTNIGTSSAEASRINPAASDSLVSSLSGSPNIVADGLASASDSINTSLSSFTRGLSVFGDNFDKNTEHINQTITQGTGKALTGVGRSLGTAAIASAHGLVFVLQLPQRTLGYIGDTRLVSAVIRPSDREHEDVPIIDPNSPDLFKAVAALSPTNVNSATPLSQWPIHGQITTEFGANDWPYQSVHTGIDISDGWRVGVTPVHAFRSGRVIEVIHSSLGLGNHVVVDHGNGVTSVYGHLYSTSVNVGQMVDLSSTLGYEGSTGASTGPHVHFEIRVNGFAADPHQFIAGQP